MNFLLDVLAASSVVLLVAVGLVVTYGWGRLINMAHGDLVMVGAYCCAIAVSAGLPFIVAVALAAVTAGAILLAADLAVFRRLPAENLTTLLATWGLGLILSEGVRLSLGPGGRFVDPPLSGLIQFGGTSIPAYQMMLAATAVVLCAAYAIVNRWSLVGLKVRAIVDAPQAASLLGIDPKRWRVGLVASGGVLAGLAGALIAPIAPVNPSLGPAYAATAFSVVLMSGNRVSSLPLFAALFLGTTRILTQTLLQPATAAIATTAISIAAVLCFQFRLSRP